MATTGEEVDLKKEGEAAKEEAKVDAGETETKDEKDAPSTAAVEEPPPPGEAQPEQPILSVKDDAVAAKEPEPAPVAAPGEPEFLADPRFRFP